MLRASVKWVAIGVIFAAAISAQAGVISATATGTGAGAAVISAPFGFGSKPVAGRNSVVLSPDFFEDTGRLRLAASSQNGSFPSYLLSGEAVIQPQTNRAVTDLVTTITVDRPSTAYLLLDNRCDGVIGWVATDSEYNDPDLQGTIQWVADNGWIRVNTGLSPNYNGQPQADWVGIDEAGSPPAAPDGKLNNFYAIYMKTFDGTLTLGAQAEGNNMYAVVVTPEPATLSLIAFCGSAVLLRRRSR